MSEKTIALSGAEVKVTFSGGNAWLRNDGAAVVYASKTAGVTAGADGVISIPAGGSAPVYGANGTVYLLGTGSVQLIGSDYSTNPFKGVSTGGAADIVSDAAESITMDNLQGGVPFSEIVLNGDIVGQDVTLTACGKNLADLSGVDGKLISGISFAYDNGNVVLNGTATAQIYVGIKIHLSAGTYTVSGSTNKNARLVLRDKSYRNIADSSTGAGATRTIVSDDYYVHIAIAAGTVCDNAIIKPQLERGNMATAYEPYHGSEVKVTPDSVPYTVPNDIRQQDGINNVFSSAGEVGVTGVRRNAAIGKIWAKLDELTAALIVTNGEI